tara:strand:- start:1555 stop:2238 length:684 start_codon:yes stop_codon:yes gene_type:complete
MKFTNSLIKGKLIQRYKRFFTDIEANNKKLIAHCPNTGSMMGLLDKGNTVWVTKHTDPKRKLKYTLELIKAKKRIIGVNTHRANRIVEHGLKNKLIDEFKSTKNIKTEFKYSDDTRFDFLCDDKILEVKNVTLLRDDNIAEFPDAPTARGLKHIKMLVNSINYGYKPYIIFLTQIQNIKYFKIAKDIDKEYYNNYLDAKKIGVKFLAYRCKITTKKIEIEKKIKFLN